jgi:16S rRNA U516 pseudouridylate synthase RsuA-like enzyme
VRSNNKKALFNARVDPVKDKVEYKGHVMQAKALETTTVVLYKPVGYIVIRKKDETRVPTVTE